MDIEEEDARRELALAAAKNKDAALALREFMSDLSEEYYSAAWLIDLEDSLWEVPEGQVSTSFRSLRAHEIEHLRGLRERAGGWWYFDKEYGELFETTEAFSERFKTRGRT